MAFAVWVVSSFAPLITPRFPDEPGIGVALMGVMGAALAFPHLGGMRDRAHDAEPGDDGEPGVRRIRGHGGRR